MYLFSLELGVYLIEHGIGRKYSNYEKCAVSFGFSGFAVQERGGIDHLIKIEETVINI
jgi:hypothetical protein